MSSRLSLAQRLDDLARLGQSILSGGAYWQEAIEEAERQNPWFTKEHNRLALQSMAEHWLQPQALADWLAAYPALEEERPMRQIGLVLAGNLPAVGWHDVLCVLVAGHHAQIKLSDKDNVLIPRLLVELSRYNPTWSAQYSYANPLKGFEAIIATGNDSSALHFQQYFQNWPHIIRRNRNSAAVLRGNETEADFEGLSRDIFRYFGLGCRSVSMLYVPQGYDFSPLLAYLDRYSDMLNHGKYRNNFDYNRSLYLLNKVPHLANDCVMLIEHDSPLSRIATLHYVQYADEAELQALVQAQAPNLQCLVGQGDFGADLRLVPFGQAQNPGLMDYADGLDTLDFLLKLKA